MDELCCHLDIHCMNVYVREGYAPGRCGETSFTFNGQKHFTFVSLACSIALGRFRYSFFFQANPLPYSSKH